MQLLFWQNSDFIVGFLYKAAMIYLFWQDIARDCLRIQVLQEFADYLCGVEPPMLEFDVAKKEYYSVAPSTDYSEAPHGDLPSDSDEVKLKCHIAQMSMIPLFFGFV